MWGLTSAAASSMFPCLLDATHADALATAPSGDEREQDAEQSPTGGKAPIGVRFAGHAAVAATARDDRVIAVGRAGAAGRAATGVTVRSCIAATRSRACDGLATGSRCHGSGDTADASATG